MIGQLTRQMDGIFCFTKEKTTFHGIQNYDEKLYKISIEVYAVARLTILKEKSGREMKDSYVSA